MSHSYGLAGGMNEIEGSEYLIARNEKSDIVYLWNIFLEKM
jgi:hypothetical protein